MMKKKRIAILLVLTLMLWMAPMQVNASPYSAYQPYAESLSGMGVFLGSGAGFELERAPTRIEGIIMLIRLLGAENEAKARTGSTIPFRDVPAWASGYVSYAYEKGLTKGVTNTSFGSNNSMDAKAFVTFALRSLGYQDAAGDFSYQNSLNFANGLGLLDQNFYSELNGKTFVRAHVARLSYDTLKFRPKGSEALLIDTLMASGNISEKTGNLFKETVISPLAISSPTAPATAETPMTTAEIANNADSIVMLTCIVPGGEAQGSGVILSSDGRIVTNYHVIEGASSIRIRFNDKTEYTGPVYIQDYNATLDLAVISISKTGLKAATISSISSLRQGEAVVAIGSPYGFFNTVTEGVVSAIREGMIQISAAISPGSSGGGLFNSRGELAGITSAGVQEAENLGFAIPISYLDQVSGLRNIPVSTFGTSTTANTAPSRAVIDPPTDIRIVSESADTVYLNWSAVSGADYYHFYYQEEGEDTFWFDKDNGVQYKYYYDSEYTVYWQGLVPGTVYRVIVTSVKDGVESNDSQVFRFTKGYGNSGQGSYGSIYYDDHYGVPDFGKFAGCSPYSVTDKSYFYEIGTYRSEDIVSYSKYLQQNGFAYFTSFKSQQGATVMVYRHNWMNLAVMTSVEILGGVPGYFIMVTTK